MLYDSWKQKRAAGVKGGPAAGTREISEKFWQVYSIWT